MFLRILLKDLKRKKTMNIILLIFVLLSACFASSSVNNIVSVFGGIDHFFEKADMSDHVMLTLNSNGVNPADEIVDKAEHATRVRKEKMIFYSAKNLFKDGEKYVEFENPGLITAISDAKLNYFDRNDEVIKAVPAGHIYVGGILADSDKVKVGDKVTLKLEDVSVDLIIDGFIKDALFGSPFMGNPRMLMNDEDAEKFFSNDVINNFNTGIVYYIDTDDVKALGQELTGVTNALFSQPASVLRLTYMLDMITAGILLVVSICLILVSFTMLSFTIKFTLSEDFREIGVMKAVGLRNVSIRGLYMIKYLCISVIGALIGYFASIPFGNMLLMTVSKRLLLGNDKNVLIGVARSLAVVLIILLFCYGCTKGIKKLSPVDAVRNGETGERYHQKYLL